MSTAESRLLAAPLGRTWPRAATAPRLFGPPVVLACLVVASLLLGLAGLRKSLPYAPEVDEPHLINHAVGVVATGELDTEWFAAPGSTFIYPLALLVHVRDVVLHGDRLLAPAPAVDQRREADKASYVVLGRLLTLAYWAASLPLLYLVGRRLFGGRVALLGTALAAVLPPVVAYAQIARSDVPSVFFGLLAIWLALRVHERPGLGPQLLAGFAVGLGASTRYFLLASAAVLLAVDAAQVWRARGRLPLRDWAALAAGGAGIVLGYALSSPYFLLNWEEAQRDLNFEGRATHVGADGLDGVGNLLWYLQAGLPDSLTWPLAAFALAGAGLALRRGGVPALAVLLYGAAFLVGTSRLGLHWARWLIPLLPLLALFAASAADALVRLLAARFGWGRAGRRAATAGLLLALAAQPAYQSLVHTAEDARGSTRARAREWLVANAAPGSRVFWEGYNRMLEGTALNETVEPTFVPGSYTRLVDRNYAYLVVTSATYDPYFAEPERYSGPVEKYQELFGSGRLVAEFRPLAAEIGALPLLGRADCWCTVAPAIGDPTIRVYALDRR